MSTTVDTSHQSLILTIDEAAAYLAIPKATLYTWRTRRVGFGPRAVKMGGCLRYRRADLDCDPDQSGPRDEPSSPTEAGDQGASGRGPGRDPHRRTPVGQRGPPRTQGHRRHGRHHRPDAGHRLSHRRDPGVALERADLDGDLPTLSVSGTIKTETGKGTYRKATPKTDTSRRTVVLPRFAADLLRVRREFATPNENDAVFATRNGTWHQVVNIERRWRQIRKDIGYEWVTPHTFRKTVATLISEAATSELASRQLGHSSSQVSLHRQAAGLGRPLRAPREAR
jgi:predicted DNA-binding transcriptional regulator AlpA